MRIVFALSLILGLAGGLTPWPAAAEDNDVIETLGALSIAPQICGIDLDREALRARARELLPEETELSVRMFRVNDRIAGEHRGWSEADRAAYCSASAELAGKLGVLR